MKLNALRPAAGSRKKTKRLGCGVGTGQGKTAGRGHKGQTSRSGGTVARGFEGGQMPLARRLPKRGFTSLRKDPAFQIVNVFSLAVFPAGSEVDAAAFYEAGLVRDATRPIKLLGKGELDVKLRVHVSAATASAIAKVEASGGAVTLVSAA